MPTDYAKEFRRYTERFERLVGDLHPGQYGHFKGRLVRRLDLPLFTAKVDDYMDLGRRFGEGVSAGDTIDDTLAVDLRAAEVELVLESSLFLPSTGA